MQSTERMSELDMASWGCWGMVSAGLQALIDGYGIGENGQIDATVNSKY